MTPDQRAPRATDEFLTVSEVAAALKLNHQTIRKWIDAGTLPALRASSSADACASCAVISMS
jgi:hypothetical protein